MAMAIKEKTLHYFSNITSKRSHNSTFGTKIKQNKNLFKRNYSLDLGRYFSKQIFLCTLKFINLHNHKSFPTHIY